MYRRTASTLVRQLDVAVRSRPAARTTAVRAVSLVVLGAATGAAVAVPAYTTRCDAAALVPAAAEEVCTVAAPSSSAARSLVDKAHDVVRAVNKVLLYLHRLVLYAVLGLPIVGVSSTAYVFGGVNAAIEDLVWDCCLWAIQQLGPTFVKLAQVSPLISAPCRAPTSSPASLAALT